MVQQVDINADVGESYGKFKIGNDEALIPQLTSCNVACGFHGGDPLTIEHTIKLALKHQVAIGAHPSYPDLLGFGRRKMNLSKDELIASLKYQVAAVKGMTESLGGSLHHVKPHGALNNEMAKDPELRQIIMDTVHEISPKLITYIPYQPHSHLGKLVHWEVFADRSYENDLSLTSRAKDNSVLSRGAIEERIKTLLTDEVIISSDGTKLKVTFDTICIHGDHPDAPETAKIIHEMAAEKEIMLKAKHAG